MHKIVPRAELKAAALDLAGRIAEGAPLALRALKAMVRATQHVSIEEAEPAGAKRNKSGVPIFEQMSASEDLVEGPASYVRTCAHMEGKKGGCSLQPSNKEPPPCRKSF